MIRVLTGLLCLLSAASVHAAPPIVIDPTLAPPRALDGIRAGMTTADARAALAEYRADDAYRDAAARSRLVRDAGAGALYYVLVKDGVIARIGIEAPAAVVAQIARRWGKPERATNLASESIASWVAASWRIDRACRGDVCRLAFHRPLTADFFGATVMPPGALAVVGPAMQRDVLARVAPVFVPGVEVPAGPEDVRLVVDLDANGRLRSILVGGLPANSRKVVEQAWGPPTAGGQWWNPDAGWRAVLDDGLHALQLFPYMPAARWLGPGVGIAAFTRPVLGAHKDKIGVLAPLAIEDGPTAVNVSYNASGRATKLVIQLPYASTARRDELVKLLEAKWGAAKRTAQTYTFSTSTVHIEAQETPAALILTLAM